MAQWPLGYAGLATPDVKPMPGKKNPPPPKKKNTRFFSSAGAAESPLELKTKPVIFNKRAPDLA